MSIIKEALERTQREGAGIQLHHYPEMIIPLSSENQRLALEAGTRILNDAGVPQLLSELAEIIKPEFADVLVTAEEIINYYEVCKEVQWHFRKGSLGGRDMRMCNAVAVQAGFLSGEIIVIGKNAELVKKEQWSSNPQFLEDAIARAYKNPLRQSLGRRRL